MYVIIGMDTRGLYPTAQTINATVSCCYNPGRLKNKNDPDPPPGPNEYTCQDKDALFKELGGNPHHQEVECTV